MTKGTDRLTVKQVENYRGGLPLHDGRGLYLDPRNGKSWVFRYVVAGKERWMGLGPYPEVSLARAREKREDARRLLKGEGIDPLAERDAQRAAVKEAAAKAKAAAVTFKQCAEKTLAAKQAGWRSSKSTDSWTATLTTYAYPTIGDLSVAAIELGHITAILEPIWTSKTETASKLRGRLEGVLDYATTHGWRSGLNPARWKGCLEHILPKPGKVARVKHHAALDWREIGAFWVKLARQDGIAARALRFTILTVARTDETFGAPWSEIDLRERVWTVPDSRTKNGKPHRVPLSDAAVELLRGLLPLRNPDRGDWVFPGGKPGQPLSNVAMLAVLERMGRGELTVHGFRSCFRTWCGETGKPEDLAEVALAHTQGKLHDAYQRGDKLERRRRLMEQWAEWCQPLPAEGDNVNEMRRAG
jgi:integrase